MNRLRGPQVVAVLAGSAFLLAGCGGVSGSHSVSPASMFLPGLMLDESPKPLPSGESLDNTLDDASGPAVPEISPVDDRTLPT